MNRESKAFKSFTFALETLFLALTGVYLVYRISKSTTFHLAWPAHFERILMCAMAVTALARLVSAGAVRKKSLAAVVLAAIYGLVYRRDGYSFLLFMAIFTVGFIDMDYRKILKLYLLAAGSIYGVTLIAGMLGVITNFVTARAGRGIRSAWGMSYYTDFASLGLFLLMFLWVALKKLPGWAMLSFCAGYLFISAYIAHSNTSTICACLLIVAVLYSSFERRFIDRSKRLQWMKRGQEWFATFGFVLLALIMFLMMMLYARGLNIGYRLNNLLSKRLQYAVNAWQRYGVKSFGTPFQQNGSGFSVFPSDKYNFVDSTYPLVLLRYGWVLFIAICVTWGWTARKAIACGDRRLLLVMGVILIHAFSEHHFVDCHFNILVVMPLAAYPPPGTDRSPVQASYAGSFRREAVAWVATAILFAGAAWLVGPALLCRMKTVLEFMHYGHGEHALRLVCVLGMVLFGFALAVWAVHRLLSALMIRSGRRTPGRALAVMLLCAVCGAGLWLYSGRVIDAAVEQNRTAIRADRKALETAVEASTGRVVSGILPAAYSREISGLTATAFFEDDLSRLHGATVLMPADAERGPFIDSGFLYVPVSDTHAIYTGDRAVIEALAGAGYPIKGYYSGVRTLNLEDAAANMGLSLDPDMGLLLEGSSGSMGQGPWQDLYGGQYKATWQLALPKGVKQPEGKLCTLRVTTNKGDSVIMEKDVKAARFDANGQLSLTARFKIPDSRNVAFEVWTEEGASVYVREVSFARSPDYDVHTFYDSRLRKVRDEYFDTDGTPMLHKDGWFACDYDYDGYGNIVRLRYYDRDGKPKVIRAGYAERRRTFNASRQVLREAYYGVDGTMIICADGYAAFEREYDSDGNVAVERYFGTEGEPLVISDGYAEVRRTYDGNKQVTGEAYYGPDGTPAMLPEGYSGVALEYDGAGNVTVRKFLDADGKPVMTKNGYARIDRQYDGQHQVVREEYLDLAGEPAMTRGGYAADEREYDEAGNAIVWRYYGADGMPVIISAGYAAVHRDYNALRQVIGERYYDVSGQPVALSYGQYGMEYGYDDVGNRAMSRYLDAMGKPMMNTEGYCEWRRVFNRQKQVTGESYYDINEAPVMTNKGYASVEWTYDAKGKLVAKRYYDIDGNLVREKLTG